MGAFNQWVQGTKYEYWKNRHVDGIAELLMTKACEYMKTKHVVAVERENSSFEDDAIAIIGMSGKFPKSDTLEVFWNNIAQGRDCISEIPEMRWSIDEYYDSNPKASGKSYSKWMGFLEDVDKFDPLFFNISPAEAELMDPQQRLFLENAWSCIEDAGLNPFSLSGSRTGVFVGCGTNDYGQVLNSQGLNAQGLMGVAPSILSARISYLLNLKGPCMSIDTACSSSLVAIAEACNSLILRTSDLALVGGVYAMAGPSMHIMTSKSGMLSPHGRCRTFDNQANGFVPGEGVGVVLLKRLSDAVRDQDPIHGVIRGWGVNQDGKTNGITAPSVNSQVALEKEVYERFNIDPDTITLIEAHGTGTKLGDPIEVEALTESFRSYTDRTGYCALGSVKSNIGHLLTAAGIAGVIKVLLALKQRMLPPTIHFESLNEHISLEKSPFYVNTELQSWEVAEGVPRRAGVSSFGFSGTNAHLVIEEYVSDAEAVTIPVLVNKDNPTLFVLSAKNEEQLKMYSASIKRFVESQNDISITDLTYTLQVGRCELDYRLAFVVDSREALLQALEGFITGDLPHGVFISQVKMGKDVVKIFEVDEDAKSLLKSLVQKRKLKEIAELWVKGLKVDWDKFYTDKKARRINIPTYPFAKECYWVPDNKIQIGVNTVEDTLESMVAIHPLLHRNTSDLAEQ
ncbi:polyketide synthase, partial [Bacillus wiedmannii]